MKKITKIQLIAIIFAVVFSVIVVIICNCSVPQVRISFTFDKPTEQNYQILKNYALGIATGRYENQNVEKLIVDGPKIEGEVLKVNIETLQMYGITAEFPINYEVNTDLKNGIIESKGTILYDQATYEEYTKVYSPIKYIILDLLLITLFTALVYATVSEVERNFKNN